MHVVGVELHSKHKLLDDAVDTWDISGPCLWFMNHSCTQRTVVLRDSMPFRGELLPMSSSFDLGVSPDTMV